ncbi:MAG TPA: transposase [Myxococcaceae bacterium]|nr:transposase [Myxococcaceae bacterium]
MRCLHGRLFLRPSERTNEVLGGVLARAVRLTGVELFAFAFASNHVHLLVRAPERNLSEFMQHLLTNISKKVGTLVGWRGAFWERRYSAEPVLDDEALLGRIRYILSHGVKEGLVASCREWPGLTSLAMMLDGRPRPFLWFHWSDRWKQRKAGKPCSRFDEKCARTEELVLRTVPHPAFRDARTRRQLLERLVQGIEEQWSSLHRSFRGRAWVLAQRPQDRPERPARSPRPLCHTTSRKLFDEFRQQVHDYVAAFMSASQRWRSGDFNVPFPVGANRPMVALAI